MNDRQDESAQIIEKMDSWAGFIELITQITAEEEGATPDDDFISATILILIEKVVVAYRHDERIRETTLRFEHNSGQEVHFTLGVELLKASIEDGEL